MKYEELFLEVWRNIDKRHKDPISNIAYFGPDAWFKFRSDPDMFRLLSPSEPIKRYCGFIIKKAFDVAKPHEIRFFIDGLHLLTANTETGNVSRVDSSDTALTVMQYALIPRLFGNNDVFRPSCSFVRVDGKTVDLMDLVSAGLLRRDADTYRVTPQGRIAFAAARHFVDKDSITSKRHWREIDRELMEM